MVSVNSDDLKLIPSKYPLIKDLMLENYSAFGSTKRNSKLMISSVPF